MTPEAEGKPDDSLVQREVSVIIPTYGREEILVNTIKDILSFADQSMELIIVDQTKCHTEPVQTLLENLSTLGTLKWVRPSRPSITRAMNLGAEKAIGDFLVFIDDDIKPEPNFIAEHIRALGTGKGDLVAGRVLQPWHSDEEDQDHFTQTTGQPIGEFIGCNFSIRKDVLLSLGGFDEQFQGAAYRYEREFADRLIEAGYRIWYEPKALIRHLHHSTGGTRSKGDHLTSWNPRHPVGAYYYLFVSPRVRNRVGRAIKRLLQSVMTRHHLRKPWYIPVTLTSEVLGFGWAIRLRLQGPKLPFLAHGPTDSPG